LNSKLPKLKWKEQKDLQEMIKAGKTCLVETETVVGLLGNLNTEQKLNEIKKSPDTKPLSLFVGNQNQIEPIWTELPPGTHELASNFWPGELTLIAGKPIKKGIRMPKINPLLELLTLTGPCVCTSANLSGDPAPKSLKDVNPELLEQVDFVIDEIAPKSSGKASTILIFDDEKNEWSELRSGSIDQATWKQTLFMQN